MRRLEPDRIRLSGDRLFYTIQGEGVNAGMPALFMRLHECNLRCDWSGAGGEICDAWYTWKKDTPEYETEAMDLTLSHLGERMMNMAIDSGCSHWVITGGEPMMQQQQLLELLAHHYEPERLEIETNGTIAPHDEWRAYDPQFNVSPKLSSSGNKEAAMFKPEVLGNLARYNSWFKFVVAQEEDAQEIQRYVDRADLPVDRVILMPEGTTREKLGEHMDLCVTLAMERGWRVTPRLQIELFGNTRGT